MAVFMRLAKEDEAEQLYQCIEDARAYHASMGFPSLGGCRAERD